MPEDQVIVPQAAPVVEAKPEVDLISKVSAFKRPEPVVTEAVDIGFDYKELEAIPDPAARETAMKAYKSMQSGATKKFQEASEIRKNAEAEIARLKTDLQKNTNWTPERIQSELLNNPQFLQAAQSIASQNPNNSGLTDAEYSVLSDREKSEMSALNNKVSLLEQANFQALISQQDGQLSSKYSDYVPTKVDESLSMLAKLPPVALREYVYKATLHDEHVKNAYEMGVAEGRGLNKEKIAAFSSEGNQATSGETIARESGESSQNYFLRIAQNRLAQFRKK